MSESKVNNWCAAIGTSIAVCAIVMKYLFGFDTPGVSWLLYFGGLVSGMSLKVTVKKSRDDYGGDNVYPLH